MCLLHESRGSGSMITAERGRTRERDKGAAEGQARENRRLDRFLMDNKLHSRAHVCPGVQTCSFAVIISRKPQKGRDVSVYPACRSGNVITLDCLTCALVVMHAVLTTANRIK